MDVDAAARFLGTNTPTSLAGARPGAIGTEDIPASPSTNLSSLAPLTSQAVSDVPQEPVITGTEPQAMVAKAKADYMARNEMPGIPLDVSTGASPWEKFVLSFMREKSTQISHLQKKYGEENVREDTNGDLIVRVMDSDTGKPKDLKVKEEGLSAKDLIDLSGSVPEIAAGIISARQSRNIPGIGPLKGFLGLQRDIAATALGAETAGAVKDIGVEAAVKGSADIPAVLKARAAMGLTDVALGEATMGAGRFFKFMESPFAGSRKDVQFDAINAQKYFKDKYGVDIPLSVGESTGSPLVSRTEAFMEKLPGGGTPFKELKAGQEEELRKLQGLMMGTVPASDEAVGRDLINRINQEVLPAKAGAQVAQGELQKTGTSQIEDIVSGLTMPQRQLLKSDTGQAVRDAVIARRDAAKAEADRLYDEVRAAPGGTGKTFDVTDLSNDARQILSSIPRKGNTPLTDFAPPDVINRLNTLIRLKGQKMSLSELQQMRRDTIEAIGNTEGVPGRGAHYLGQISDAITKSIESGAASMPTTELKTALDAANKYYREEVVPFNRTGITELFRKPDEAGNISNSEIVSRLFGGGKAIENYQLMKDTLTPASPEFIKLKRAVADNLLERSRYPGGDLIDPESFMANLSQFKRDYREIADDIFGNKFTKMINMAKTMSFGPLSSAEKEAAGMGGITTSKVSSDDFQKLLMDPNPTAAKLRALVTAEGKRDDLYKNDLMKAVAKGELPDKTLNPEDFVNRFVDSSKPEDVKQVMNLVGTSGPLLDDVRAKTLEKLFRDASRSATPGDLGKLMSGDPTRIMSGTSMYKQIENPNVREKMEAILGPDIFEDLKQYINVAKAGEAKERAFQAAGGLAAGMQIASLTRGGPLKYMYEASKDWVAAKLLTSAPMRAWLGSVPSASDPGFVSLLVTSPPFLKAVTEDFGKGTSAEAFISSIKQSVDKWLKIDAPKLPAPQQTGEQNRQKMWEQFLNTPQTNQ